LPAAAARGDPHRFRGLRAETMKLTDYSLVVARLAPAFAPHLPLPAARGEGRGEGASSLGVDFEKYLQRHRLPCIAQTREEDTSPSVASLPRPLPARRGEVKCAS